MEYVRKDKTFGLCESLRVFAFEGLGSCILVDFQEDVNIYKNEKRQPVQDISQTLNPKIHFNFQSYHRNQEGSSPTH